MDYRKRNFFREEAAEKSVLVRSRKASKRAKSGNVIKKRCCFCFCEGLFEVISVVVRVEKLWCVRKNLLLLLLEEIEG